MKRPANPWKPPAWLLTLDFAGVALLALGLYLHYAPETSLASGPLGAWKQVLLVGGGALLVACALIATRLVLAHRRSQS